MGERTGPPCALEVGLVSCSFVTKSACPSFCWWAASVITWYSSHMRRDDAMTEHDCIYKWQYIVDISSSNLVSSQGGYPNSSKMLAHMVDYVRGAIEDTTNVLGIRVRTTPWITVFMEAPCLKLLLHNFYRPGTSINTSHASARSCLYCTNVPQTLANPSVWVHMYIVAISGRTTVEILLKPLS